MTTPAQATAELAFALSTRQMDQAVKLLGQGADPNVRIQQNKGLPSLCALEWAISRFYPLHIIRALVDAGARLDSNQQVKEQMSLLSVALRCCNLPAVALLKDKLPVGDGEWRAVKASCNPEVAAQAILPRDQKLDEKHPAAMLCAESNGMAFVRLLHARGMRWAGLAASSSFHAKCLRQKTGVYLEVVRLAHRQDPKGLIKALGKSGTTPLHGCPLASEVSSLLNDPVVSGWKEFKDKRGRTPLVSQMWLGHIECVEKLLQAGCAVPALRQGEQRVDYAARVVGKKIQGWENHPVFDQVWARATADCLEASVLPAVSRPRNRL